MLQEHNDICHLQHFHSRSHIIKPLQRKENKFILKKLSTIRYNDLNKITLQEHNIIDIIKHTSFARSYDQLKIIIKALSSSELFIYLTKILHIDEVNVIRLFTTWASMIVYSFFSPGQILFATGDKGKKVYIIINGSIKLTRLKFTEKMLSPFDYYNILQGFHEVNETILLQKTIEANSDIYPIEEEDFDELRLILFKKKFSSLKTDDMKKYYQDIVKLMQKFKLTIEMLNITIFDKNEIEGRLSKISIDKVNQYSYLLNVVIKEKLSIYSYDNAIANTTGSFIGKTAHYVYCEKAIALTNCDLITIPYDSYIKEITIERQRVIDKEVSFLLKHYFFKCIYSKKFERTFYNLFTYTEYSKNDIIIQENIKCEDIIFVKQGKIELSMNKTPLEMHTLILYLEDLLSMKGEGTAMECYVKNIMKDPKDKIEEYQSKRLIKMFVINDKEMISSEFCYYGMNSGYTAKVISQKAIVYRLSLINLYKIFKEEKEAFKAYEENSHNKIELLHMRMININSLIIGKIEQENHKVISNNHIDGIDNREIDYNYHDSNSPLIHSKIKQAFELNKPTKTQKNNNYNQSNDYEFYTERNSILPLIQLSKFKFNHPIEDNMIKKLKKELKENHNKISSDFIFVDQSIDMIKNYQGNEEEIIAKRHCSSLSFMIEPCTKNKGNSLFQLNKWRNNGFIKNPKDTTLYTRYNMRRSLYPNNNTFSTNNDSSSNTNNKESNKQIGLGSINIENAKTKEGFYCNAITQTVNSFPGHRTIYSQSTFNQIQKKNVSYKKNIINQLSQLS